MYNAEGSQQRPITSDHGNSLESPVEAFQGLESQFVTISTTRVRCHFFEPDKSRGIGIIGQEKNSTSPSQARIRDLKASYHAICNWCGTLAKGRTVVGMLSEVSSSGPAVQADKKDVPLLLAGVRWSKHLLGPSYRRLAKSARWCCGSEMLSAQVILDEAAT